MARINGLESADEVAAIVSSARYLVLGLGDVYLGAPCAVPLDPRHRLVTSKYNPARTFTPEGSVGIGGVYMCERAGSCVCVWGGCTDFRAFLMSRRACRVQVHLRHGLARRLPARRAHAANLGHVWVCRSGACGAALRVTSVCGVPASSRTSLAAARGSCRTLTRHARASEDRGGGGGGGVFLEADSCRGFAGRG